MGTPADTATAITYARWAAETGSYKAMSMVGDALFYGWADTEPNSDSAYYYYYMASQGDDPRGDYMIGDLLYEEEMYEQSLQYILSAVRNGSVDALVAYGRALWLGAGIEENPELASSFSSRPLRKPLPEWHTSFLAMPTSSDAVARRIMTRHSLISTPR